MFHVYILRCADNSLYVGHCEDVEARRTCHQNGKAAAWTAKRRPVKLVYSEPFPTRAAAIARERQLKRWSHAKKSALIRGDQDELKRLAKRRTC